MEGGRRHGQWKGPAWGSIRVPTNLTGVRVERDRAHDVAVRCAVGLEQHVLRLIEMLSVDEGVEQQEGWADIPFDGAGLERRQGRTVLRDRHAAQEIVVV